MNDSQREAIELNRRSWDERVPIHFDSRFYGVDAFRHGQQTLGSLESEWLAGIEGKSVLHLMCHFGLDSMLLSRMGAAVTGIDFSSAAVARASELAAELGLSTRFEQADVLEADLGATFDVVFTSWGILPWLADLDAWAATIRRHLAPAGRFVMFDFHPQCSVFDADLGFAYPYLDAHPVREVHGTYTDAPAGFAVETVQWQWTTGQLVTALLKAGLRITRFEEFDRMPWRRFGAMQPAGAGLWGLQTPWFPLAFGIEAMLDG